MKILWYICAFVNFICVAETVNFKIIINMYRSLMGRDQSGNVSEDNIEVDLLAFRMWAGVRLGLGVVINSVTFGLHKYLVVI